MVEITDFPSVVAWISDDKTESDEKAALAARSALRSLPFLGPEPFEGLNKVALPLLRAAMASSVASVSPRREIMGAVRSADRASDAIKDFVADEYETQCVHRAVLAAIKVAHTGSSKEASVSISQVVHAASESAYRQGNYDYDGGTSAAEAQAEAKLTCRSAKTLDAKNIRVHGAAGVFAMPLWPDSPDFFQEPYAKLKDFWEADEETWGFWMRWYEGMLTGEPMDWALQEQIILSVQEETWRAGAGAVANRIKEIEDEFYSLPDLDEAQLASTVERITSQPVLFRDAAEATGLQVEATITEYKADLANGLPKGFEAFEKLPPIYSNIAQIIDQGTNADEIERLKTEIKHLHSVINELKRDLRNAREQLREKRLNAVEVAQMRTFGERLLTTLGCIGFIGTFGISTAMFFGYGKEDLNYESLKEQIEGLSSEMAEIEPRPEVNEPEETPQGPKFVKPPSE